MPPDPPSLERFQRLTFLPMPTASESHNTPLRMYCKLHLSHNDVYADDISLMHMSIQFL